MFNLSGWIVGKVVYLLGILSKFYLQKVYQLFLKIITTVLCSKHSEIITDVLGFFYFVMYHKWMNSGAVTCSVVALGFILCNTNIVFRKVTSNSIFFKNSLMLCKNELWYKIMTNTENFSYYKSVNSYNDFSNVSK